ncbi:MAG TPA: ester cyclase [Gaiellaceae bacterium]
MANPGLPPARASARARELLGRRASAELHEEVRALWKRHSIAEDKRDLPGLIATLTEDCVYAFAGRPERWQGHAGASRFYEELLRAFPDIEFALTQIVIGPQGVCEEAVVTATHERDWLDLPASGERLEFEVAIFFPFDLEQRLFRGERIYLAGLPSS